MEDLTCRLVVFPGPRPSLSLGFELTNSGERTWAGTVLEPLVPWDLRAWADGQAVQVRQPALDLPLRPRTLSLAPGATEELPCPIVLVFGESDPSPFVWSLDMPPGPVELEGSITVDNARCALPRRWYDGHRT